MKSSLLIMAYGQNKGKKGKETRHFVEVEPMFRSILRAPQHTAVAFTKEVMRATYRVTRPHRFFVYHQKQRKAASGK